MNKLRKIVFVSLLISLCSGSIFGQTITWQKEYSSEKAIFGTSVVQDSDGSFLLCGINNKNFQIIRVNSFGDTLWSRNYPGGYLSKVIYTLDNHFVICGDISGGFQINGYLLKIDKNSNIIWTRQIVSNLGINISDIYETIDGNLNIIGTKNISISPPPVRKNMIFFKYDENGNLLLNKEFDSTGVGIKIVEIPGKGFLLTGTSTIITDYSGNVIKMYKNFNTYGGLYSIENDGYIFLQKSDSNLIPTIKIFKTDTLLNIVWSQNFSNNQKALFANEFIKTSNRYVICGQSINFNEDSFGLLFGIDLNGTLKWEKEYMRANYYIDFRGLTNCSDNGFITIGTTEKYNTEESKFLATKTDSIGNTNPLLIYSNPESIPTYFNLYQNYPNPFNNSTVLKFSINSDALVSINIYNINGQKVNNVLNSSLKAGLYEIKYNMLDEISGIYFCEIKMNFHNKIFSKTIKICLIK